MSGKISLHSSLGWRVQRPWAGCKACSQDRWGLPIPVCIATTSGSQADYPPHPPPPRDSVLGPDGCQWCVFWVSSHKLFSHHIASDSLHVSLLPLPMQRFFVYVRTLYGQTSVASRFMFVQCTFSGRCCLVLLVLAPRWFRKSTSRHLLYLLVDLCQGLFAAWWQQPCWLQFEVNLNNLCLGNLLLLKAFRWPLANYKDVMRPERKRCSWSSERKA